MSVFKLPTHIEEQGQDWSVWEFDDLCSSVYIKPLDIDDCELSIEHLTTEEVDKIMDLVVKIRAKNG